MRVAKAGNHAAFHQAMTADKARFTKSIAQKDDAKLLANYKHNGRQIAASKPRVPAPDWRLYQRMALMELKRRGVDV